MKTTVEWLVEQMQSKEFIYRDRTTIIEQAKEMEKEQMFDIMQQFAAFCVKCDREKLPLLFAKEWFEQFKK
jgi:hypothetical protein